MTQQIRLELTPLGALQLLVQRVREVHIDGDTPNLNEAMQAAEEVLARETQPIEALDDTEKFHIWCAGDGSWMSENPRIFTKDRDQRGSWNHEVAVRLSPSGDFQGMYRIYPANTPQGINPKSQPESLTRQLAKYPGGSGSEAQ